MEHAAGMTHLCSKRLTYADICDFAKNWYQEAKGVGKWPPARHAKDSNAPPSSFTHSEVHSLVQCFQKGQPTSQQHDKSNGTCNLCSEKGHWANKCPNKACFTTKLDLTLQSPTNILQDLHNVLDTEIHVGTVDTTNKDEEDSKQSKKVGNIFLQQTQSPPCLYMDVPFIGAPCAHPLGGLLPT